MNLVINADSAANVLAILPEILLTALAAVVILLDVFWPASRNEQVYARPHIHEDRDGNDNLQNTAANALHDILERIGTDGILYLEWLGCSCHCCVVYRVCVCRLWQRGNPGHRC